MSTTHFLPFPQSWIDLLENAETREEFNRRLYQALAYIKAANDPAYTTLVDAGVDLDKLPFVNDKARRRRR